MDKLVSMCGFAVDGDLDRVISCAGDKNINSGFVATPKRFNCMIKVWKP